jgi:hypothetical protein
MSRQEREDYSSADDALIRKEERAKDRRDARAEASAENFKKEIAALFKNPDVKRKIAREADGATKDPDRIRRFQEGAGEGTFRAYHSDEIIDGWEDRPWERD